jgi:hypothetical protein
MRQLFFIAPNGYPQVKASGVMSTHGWCAAGDDPTKDQIMGVVEMQGNTDAEKVIDKLEAAGIHWLPNHLANPNQTISPEHADLLEKHGVLPTDTTTQAMTKLHAKFGFPPLKPNRF